MIRRAPSFLLVIALAVPAWAQVPGGMPGVAPAMPGGQPGASDAAHEDTVPTSPAAELYQLMGNKNYVDWQSSLLFPGEDQQRLQHVLDLVAAGKNDEAMSEAGIGQQQQQDPLDAMIETVSPEKPMKNVWPPEVPIFYLSSILYHSDDDWVLWVNGQRFTARKTVAAEKGLEVVSVTPDSASFSWGPIQFDKVQAKLTPALDNPAPAGSLGIAGRTTIDAPTHRVIFTLTPNQTFYTLVPTVSEGLPFRDRGGERSLPGTTRLGPTSPPGTPFVIHKPIQVPADPKDNSAAAATPNMNGVPLIAQPLPKDPKYNDIQGMLDRADKLKAEQQQRNQRP